MIIATFNVNGVRARAQHILDWLDQRRPDIVCLQEIKCQDKDFPTTAFEAAGYHSLVRGQKAYNGVAILSRRPPDETTAEFGDGGDESEARLITARWGGLWVINTYVPQGRDITDPAFQAKLEFLGRVRNLIADRFQNHDLVLWTGDINAALSDLDVYHPEKHWGKVEYNQQEIDAVNAVLDLGYSDLVTVICSEPTSPGPDSVHLLGLPPAQRLQAQPGLADRPPDRLGRPHLSGQGLRGGSGAARKGQAQRPHPHLGGVRSLTGGDHGRSLPE